MVVSAGIHYDTRDLFSIGIYSCFRSFMDRQTTQDSIRLTYLLNSISTLNSDVLEASEVRTILQILSVN